MRHFLSTPGSCIILSLLCVSQFTESAAFFYWGSSYNRTKAFSRRTRAVDSPSPVDCKLKSWTPWTPCDGCTEKTVRFQYVERLSQFGGTSCVLSQWDEKRCPVQGECKDDCGDLQVCPETGRCISRHLLCNGDMDCQLGSDEDECEEVKRPENKCTGMLRIPGAPKATQGYNALSDVFVSHVLDPSYFGGICEYIYNGEWREMTYDSFCEHLYYNDDEKYFRKPYNFLYYRMMAHSRSEGSTEVYNDAASLLNAERTEKSFNFGVTFGIMYVEAGLSMSHEKTLLNNISRYNSEDVEFIRLRSTVETAQFKMRTRDLMLHEDMLQSLMELPEQYDFGAYSRFINEYGTHYVTQGVMGGILDYILVLDRRVMRTSKLESRDVANCVGVSLGISFPYTEEIEGKLTVSHDSCKRTGDMSKGFTESDDLVRDVIGFVKGGIVTQSAAQLAVRNAETYRAWGKSLKHNPAVIKHETLPIYELIRFSTAAAQAGPRVQHLKQAWEEYMQQFNPCRCVPCRNNGVPVLSRTSCSCLCKQGYDGLACERSTRTSAPVHGQWSCWSSWSSCTSGRQTRRRECNNPAPKDGGDPCRGTGQQSKPC